MVDPKSFKPAAALNSVGRSAPLPGDRTAAAAYIAELSSDMASIARQYGLSTLGYLLDMARLEAEIEASALVHGSADPPN